LDYPRKGGFFAGTRRKARPASLVVVLLLVAGASSHVTPAGRAAGGAGYSDFSYGTTPTAPTAKENQSKLWFNDGSWWGALFSKSSKKYKIFRRDAPTQTWIETAAVVDERSTSRVDTLWDGAHLYVATAGTSETSQSQSARILRFSYDSQTDTYTLDAGFPLTITSGGMQAIVIARDTTGTLWATYAQNSQVYVTHSAGSDLSWVTPYVLPATGATGLLSQDESSIVSYNSHVGIMWGDQAHSPMTYYFAVHNDGDPDTVWQSTIALQGPEIADNHINLKGLEGDPAGQVFAAVKTSLNRPGDPLYYLLVLKQDGTWAQRVFGTVADDHTRAQVVIDQSDRQVYMYGSSPCCSGGIIYYKETSLDNIAFGPGKGTPLIASATDTHINNPSSTKQTVSSASGLVVLGSDDATRFYLHSSFGLGAGDTAPPETTIDSGPSGTQFSTSASFTFSSSESGSSFSCSVDGAAFSSCVSPQTYNGLATGSHTFQVRATDLSANADPTPAAQTWTVDTHFQTVTLSPTADARVEQANASTNFGTNATLIADNQPNTESYLSFSVSGTGGAVVGAKLRLFAFDGTSDGPQAYGAANSWTETGITWNTSPARTTALLDDKGTIASNTWVEFDVGAAVTGDGTYSFEIAPMSSDGISFRSREAGTDRPQLVLTVADSTPPETTIDTGPSGAVGSSSASFSFSSSEPGSTFACSLDGAAFGACTSPRSYTGLADGGHTFEVRATDSVGNADASPAVRSWSVDTIAPAAPTIASPPAGSLSGSSVTVAGDAEVGSTVRLYDGAVLVGTTGTGAGGSWSVPLTGLADGTHSFTATATDAAGNVSPASASRTVTVDTTPPETTIDAGPSGLVASTSASFAFSSSEPNSTFACSLDGGPFGACTSPRTYSGLTEGGHTFLVRATDAGANTDTSSASRSWTVDLTPPTVSAVSPPDQATGVSTSSVVAATFSEAMSDSTVSATTFALKVTQTGTPVSASVSYDPATRTATLTPGPLLTGTSYTARIVGGAGGVTDLAGNPLSVDRTWSFTTSSADTSPPETSIDQGPSGTVASTSASFAFSSSEPGSTFACSLDGAGFGACTSPHGYTGLAQGAHTFQVRATDAAGNVDPTPASASWTVDTFAPAPPQITAPAEGSLSGSSLTVAGTAEPGALVEVFDGAGSAGTTNADGTGNWSKPFTGLADGTHSFTAKATDAVGNVSAASAPRSVTVDSALPDTTIDSGPSGTLASTSATFTFSASEAGSTFACSLDGAAFSACTSPQTYSGLAEGTHTFQVRASDSVGNTDSSPATRSWTVSLTLFSDGFESGDFSAWSTVATAGDGTAQVQSTVVKSGGFAGRLSETANVGSTAYARKTFGSPLSDLTVTGWFDLLAEGVSGGNVPLLRLFDAAGARLVVVYRQNLSGDSIWLTIGSNRFSTTGKLPLSTWGQLDLRITGAGTASGTLELRLNGNLIYQSASAVLAAPILTLQIGNDTARQTFTLVADDIVAH
jgi:hypothetical protein